MHDARDAEDMRLLEAGEYRRLLENIATRLGAVAAH
jgi:hypothetical protein